MKKREGTTDTLIIDEVCGRNCYKLDPNVVSKYSNVVDVGAHIGSFVIKLRQLGFTGHVSCFEPNPDTFSYLKQNVEGAEKTSLHQSLVWRSDEDVSEVSLSIGKIWTEDRSKVNHADCKVISNGYEANTVKVPVVKFDSILQKIFNEHGRINLLKLDCEGSEYPLLYTSKALDLVDSILLEYHRIDPGNEAAYTVQGFTEYDREGLVKFLESQGFKVTEEWRSLVLGEDLLQLDRVE